MLSLPLGTCPYVDVLPFFLASFGAFFLSFFGALLPLGDARLVVLSRCARAVLRCFLAAARDGLAGVDPLLPTVVSSPVCPLERP